MKKPIALLLAIIMVLSTVAFLPPHLVVSANPNRDIVPDFRCDNFLAAVRHRVSIPSGPIRYSDVQALTVLQLNGAGIVDLAGIENFTNLRELNVAGNRLLTLNLSRNLALERVEVRDNHLVPGARTHLNELGIQHLTGVNLQQTLLADIIDPRIIPRGIIDTPYTHDLRPVANWPISFDVTVPTGWTFMPELNRISGTPTAAHVEHGVPITVAVYVNHPWSTVANPARERVTAQALSIPVNQTFVPAENITITPIFGQVGITLLVTPTIHPAIATERHIEWEIVGGTAREGATVTPRSYGSDQITVSASMEGTVTLRATMVNASGTPASRANLVRYFIITFAGSEIIATVYGLESLYVGTPVRAYVVYSLDRNIFAREITPGDFRVTGLPPGLNAGAPIRISDTEVRVPITGIPTRPMTSFSLITPASIPARNIHRGTIDVGVVRQGLDNLGPIHASALIMPTTAVFDINPQGLQHRNINVYVRVFEDDQDFRFIRFGNFNLREDRDFSPLGFDGDAFVIYASFMAGLPIGEWDLVFVTRRGTNPVLRLTIIDSSIVEEIPPLPIAPAPLPPVAQPHPDETFFYLSGGQSVGINSLYWNINRARVNPAMQNGTATVTIRASVLDDLAWRNAGASFEIFTPITRVTVPLNLIDSIHGARAALVNHGLSPSQVDVRISITDRTNDGNFGVMYNNLFPNGEILSPLAELRVELVNAATGAVIMNAHELTNPIDLMFVVMARSPHIRPAGVYFNQRNGRVEFAPHRALNSNEITVRSMFTGVHAVAHNGTHFHDVELTHWGFNQTFTAAYSGLIVATGGELSPHAIITRGEFVRILAYALQLPRYGIPSSGYVDVTPDNPFYDAINRARAAGVLLHFGGDTFHPNAAITREEMLATIGVATTIWQPIEQIGHRPLVAAFTDFPLINDWLVVDIQRAMNFGLLEGFPDFTLRPREHATRIEALAVIVNLAQLLGRM
jgi:hypothetical protein